MTEQQLQQVVVQLRSIIADTDKNRANLIILGFSLGFIEGHLHRALTPEQWAGALAKITSAARPQ